MVEILSLLQSELAVSPFIVVRPQRVYVDKDGCNKGYCMKIGFHAVESSYASTQRLMSRW